MSKWVRNVVLDALSDVRCSPNDDRIEYGLIAAGISVAIIATVQALGTNLNATFSSVSTALK
jgi:pilus assembly protein Flp/PilA